MIVITTPTGDIGSQVLAELLQTDEELRVIARDPAKLSAAACDRAEVLAGSHGDPAVLERAFTGADAVFWVVPPNSQAASLEAAYSGFTRPAADAIKRFGVGHVVGVSALGRGTAHEQHAGLVTASLAMDDLIADTGVAYRALANPSFMDNLLRQAASIRDEGIFTGTEAADHRAPTAATRDIAAVATRLLTERDWTGTGEVAVLGPEDLTPAEQAAVMSEVLGRDVSYVQRSLADLAAQLSGYGMGAAFVDGMVEMMRAKDNGLDAGVERTPETASPTSFRAWCEAVLKPAVV